MEIIKGKSATIMSTCCQLGAFANNNTEAAENLGMFGTELGMAFQIRDDVLDLTANQKKLGKELFYKQRELGIDAAYALAMQAMNKNIQNDDAREGIKAFVEKRTPPKWRDIAE